MELGDRLRELRDKKGLNQIEFAKIMGMPNQNISNYERGFRQPDYETLRKFADYFEVSTDYLLGRTDNTHPLPIIIAGQEIQLTPDEYKVFLEMQKYPQAFNDLQSDPERKVKRMIKMWDLVREQLIELENED